MILAGAYPIYLNSLVILLNYLDTTPQAKCRFNTYRV